MQKSDEKQPPRQASFYDHLKQALEAIDRPVWPGSHSPLAAPYFLGAARRGADPTPAWRGEVLRAEIDRAVESL